MRAWFLTALLAAPASAAVVVEAVPAAPAASAAGAAAVSPFAAVSPVPVVPVAPVLAPSLGASVLQAFPGMGMNAVHLVAPAASASAAAPAAAATASASPAPRAAEDGPQRGRRDTIPPSPSDAARAMPAVNASRARGAAAPTESLAVDPSEASDERGLGGDPTENAADAGRRLFDRSERRAALDAAPSASGAFVPVGALAGGHSPAASAAADAPAPTPASGPRSATGRAPKTAVASAPLLGRDEVLRDAVAAAPSAALRPATAFTGSFSASSARLLRPALVPSVPAAPRPEGAVASVPAFDRLLLETGGPGLVVQVRAALGLPSADAEGRSAAGPVPPSPSAAREGTPVTSTEWLERRGLIETLAASEAAAAQALVSPARAMAPAARPSRSAPTAPRGAFDASFLAWWSLAFLPAIAVLAKDVL